MSIFDDLITAYDEQKQLIDAIAEELTPFIAEAVALLSETLISGNKILTMGSTDVQPAAAYVTQQLLHPCAFERPSLPSILLSAPTGYCSPSTPDKSEWIQQLSALAQTNDCLLIFAGQQNINEIQAVIEYAQTQQIHVVCLCDSTHRSLPNTISHDEVCIQLSSIGNAQFHFSMATLLKTLIERQIFGA